MLKTPQDDDLKPTEFASTSTGPGSGHSGEQIGPYRLLDKLGEGGMGEVWPAEQFEPVKRKVALKVIKQGMDTKQVVARFEGRETSAGADGPSGDRQGLRCRGHAPRPAVLRDEARPRRADHQALRPAQADQPKTPAPVHATLLLFAVLLACAADRPLVQRFEQGDWQPVPFRITSMGGQYAAPRVVFVLRLEGPSGRRLTVEGSVEIDPRPTLVGGRWFEEGGSTARSGVLSSAAVDYFGGQGGRPSLGGQFTLSTDDATIYRINLPRTTLTAER